MLRGDKPTGIQIMYFTLADQWPSDDEIERAYVLIKKDLTEQNGRPREIPVAKGGPVEFRQSEILVSRCTWGRSA